jgi:hypothetical protein
MAVMYLIRIVLLIASKVEHAKVLWGFTKIQMNREGIHVSNLNICQKIGN